MKVLVIGALGTVGRKLVPELVRQGHQVVISSRDPTKMCPWPTHAFRRFTLDLLDFESISPALQGIDTIYYLMHGMSDGEHHSARELKAARNLIQAAHDSSVKRIIYLGSLLSIHQGSEHLQARKATGKILASSTIQLIELRAGIIVAPGSAAFEVMRDLMGNLPFILAPRSIDNKVPPIALSDIVYYLVQLLAYKERAHCVLEAAGPEWLTYREMMIRLAQKLGRRCRVWAVPGLPISWIRLVLALVTSVPMGLAKALIAGLAEPLQANPSRLQQLFPHALLTYEQAIDAVFAEERIEFYPPRWQDGVPAFRNFSSRHGFYGKSAKHSIRVEAPAPQLWAVVNLLGGEYRYFYMDWLWAMREWMDWCLGGSGRQHGRTNPRQLVVGDKVDSWTILSVESPHLLVMKFEMKAPGGGGMQICIDTLSSDESLLTLELHWHPAGLWGLVYWYFFAPWHQLLLHGMARNMARLARQQSPL